MSGSWSGMGMGIMGLIGVALAVAGLAGVVYSIAKLFAIRRSDLSDQEARDAMGPLLPKNMLAVLAAMLGLMLMVVDLMV